MQLIFATANPNALTLSQAEPALSSLVITKPYSLHELTRLVKQLLARQL